jgi:hypothetical protein
MTEAEAKTKWCPFARSEISGMIANRPMNYSSGNSNSDRVCIGSSCMAWRWDGQSEYRHPKGPEFLRYCQGTPEDVGATFHREGYCGLAGSP